MPHYTPISPIVSVLMMTHNAEDTVRRAVESFQNQTLQNFELVVVDAGSEDATVRLLNACAERDLRIVVVQTQKLERQEALSLALERARGTWILVADADGWVEPALLAELTSCAEAHDLDLVVGGFSIEVSLPYGRKHENELVASANPMIYPSQHDFRAAAWQLFATGQLLPASAKLFSRTRIEAWNVLFDPQSNTDHTFTSAYLRHVQHVGVLGGVGYHVHRLSAPIDGSGVDAVLIRDHLLEKEQDSLLELYHAWGLDGDIASMEMLQNRYLERLLDCIEDVCWWGSPLSFSEQQRVVSEMIGTENAQLAVSVASPQNYRARMMLVPVRKHEVARICAQARLISIFSRTSVSQVIPDFFI